VRGFALVLLGVRGEEEAGGDVRLVHVPDGADVEPVVPVEHVQLRIVEGHVGAEIRGPVIVVDNIGDPVDSEAYKEAYERTVAGAGNTPLLRTTWIASAGHGNQTVLERLAGFVKLIERLDTGKWSSTSARAVSEAAAQIDAESDLSLGASRFIDYHPLKPLREWDGRDFGTYDPEH
jgi:hypothetical protein